MSKEAFLEAWAETGRAEGGYANDPDDSGGETNWGITVAVARQYGYDDLMIDMPCEVAEDIAKKVYWDTLELDTIAEMSAPIAKELFDSGFNMGQKRPIRFIQRSLNALNRGGQDYPDQEVDGILGSKTLSALNIFLKRRKESETIILRCLNGLQLAFYMSLVERREKDEKFLNGWILNRVVI